MSDKKELKPDNLPPEAQAVVKTKTIRAKKRLSGWLVLLKTLAQFDEVTDEARAKAMSRVITSGIIIFLGVFFTIFGSAMTDGNLIIVYIGVPVVLLALIRIIINGVKAARLGKVDLANDFRETLLPLLTILQNDIPKKGKLMLDLNMSSGVEKTYRISEQKLPPGRFRKLIETIFEIGVCTAEFPLVNDTILKLDIAKRYISYDRYYTNPRGKHKHKKKWKLLTTVTTEVVPSGEAFDISEERVNELAGKEKIRMKEKKGDPLCRLTRKFKFKSDDGSRPENCVPPEAIIDMYMQLCSALNGQERGNA